MKNKKLFLFWASIFLSKQTYQKQSKITIHATIIDFSSCNLPLTNTINVLKLQQQHKNQTFLACSCPITNSSSPLQISLGVGNSLPKFAPPHPLPPPGAPPPTTTTPSSLTPASPSPPSPPPYNLNFSHIGTPLPPPSLSLNLPISMKLPCSGASLNGRK